MALRRRRLDDGDAADVRTVKVLVELERVVARLEVAAEMIEKTIADEGKAPG